MDFQQFKAVIKAQYPEATFTIDAVFPLYRARWNHNEVTYNFLKGKQKPWRFYSYISHGHGATLPEAIDNAT